jgi:hypothetical protein
MGLRANYTNSILHIGRQYIPPATTSPAFNFFDTMVHSGTIGPTYTLDGGDTLFLKFNYLSSELTNTAGTQPPINFTAQSIQPEYVTKFVRDWTAKISGGATIIEQAGNRTFASGSFSLTNDFDRQTQVAVAVSRQAAPAYVGVGGAFISNVAQLYVRHGFSRVVSLTIGGNYAHNETTPVKSFTIETYNGSADLDYNLTRSTKLSFSQTYSHFNITGIPSYDRIITMLSVSIEWK